MLRKLLTEKYPAEESTLVDELFLSIKAIQQKLEEELASKQKVIEGSWEEIRTLRVTIQEKNRHIQQLERAVAESQRTTEGNRQIINKLLNDLDRMQQDIEWYKRTYQRRSFVGYLKEYLFGSKSK